ncbi:MAG: putative membrane protein [Cenarchaeum symbiont of Oopsacas minuta]|nr:putative membrane protein [Cenarchaeum symbiont of Oopsacas minuta]
MDRKIVLGLILITVMMLIIVSIMTYNYNIDQKNARGLIFGHMLQSIQNNLETEQIDFDAKLSVMRNNKSTLEEFSIDAEKHFTVMKDLISRYETLEPPEPYESAVKFFKLSTQSQLDRDRQIVLFIKTGDSAYEARADDLHQESFEYELAALADYKTAQTGQNP